MSLPTGGIPGDQSSLPNMFTQANQAPGLQPGLSLMNMQAMPQLGHHPHPFVLGGQSAMMHLPPGAMATAAEAMAIASTTASNSRLGHLGEQANLRFPTGVGLNENGHGMPISSQHSVTDNASGVVGPYANITVKQEMGVGGLPGHRPPPPLVQHPQLSSTDGQHAMPNPFSVAAKNIPVSKHICAVCGDRASGKHYGVYSCEGCKGFFKRTVRKYLTYTCRDDKDCVIDKRQRNRCQYCRYQKCLSMGMKKEAVQEERQKNRDQEENTADVSAFDDMSVDKIYQAEVSSDPKPEEIAAMQETTDLEASVNKAADHQMYTLVGWAKKVPHFCDLPLDDQVTLLRAGWNELLIASFSHRSMEIPDGIILASGLRVYRQTAQSAGVGTIFDRVLTELIAKMRDMSMDRTELGCLRAIVLFNPDIKDLTDSSYVESLREKVYASLEIYCKTKYPEQPGRFAKLLLRLPALRSIGLKCLEHLFFFKLLGNSPIDQFLVDKLTSDKGNPAPPSRQASSSNDYASTSASPF